MMGLKEWNRSLEYVAYECAKFPNIKWGTYVTYDGRKGIRLMLMDSMDNIFAERYTGRCDSFAQMKEAIQDCIRLLMNEM